MGRWNLINIDKSHSPKQAHSLMKARPGVSLGKDSFGKEGKEALERHSSHSHAPGSYETRLHLGLIFPAQKDFGLFAL